ncbi:MAG: hypothetical protein U0527_16195 [Candidatus Eisenbacteria bacterium]
MGDSSLCDAAIALRERGVVDARLDSTASFVYEADRLLGYASWGSNDAGYRLRLPLVAGSAGATFVSTSARTFREPPSVEPRPFRGRGVETSPDPPSL